jgi:hypothetical protein
MEAIIKAIEELKKDINKRIDLLEANQYKENTLLLRDVYKVIASEKKQEQKVSNDWSNEFYKTFR